MSVAIVSPYLSPFFGRPASPRLAARPALSAGAVLGPIVGTIVRPIVRPIVRRFVRPIVRRFVRQIAGLLGVGLRWLAVAGLAGCAVFTPAPDCATPSERSVEALQRLDGLRARHPASRQCQQLYLELRDEIVAGELEQAERFRREGHVDRAAHALRKVQGLEPEHVGARQGLLRLEREDRLRRLLDAARRAVDGGDFNQARSSLDAVRRLAPENREAQQLQATLATAMAIHTPPADDGLQANFRKPLSLEFREVPMRQIFEVMSLSSGLNFVFDKDVKTDQKTSIVLRDSTAEAVLHFLLLTNQLDYQVISGNTLLVYPNNTGKQKEYQELAVRTFPMVNTDVKAVAAALKTLFKGRDFHVDEKQNMLVARDTPEALRVVEKLVDLYDVAEPEVMLEVAILEISRKRLQNLGVDFPDSLTLAPLASDRALGLTLNDLRGLGSQRLGAAVAPLSLNLKKEDTDVNLLANPRIRVVNREKAKVMVGEKVPIVSVTTTPGSAVPVATENISYVDIGIKLDVEPVIYRDNEITLKIGLEVSNISGSTTTRSGGIAYTFGNRTANTTLRLRDGENQILAGLINDEDRKVASRLPGIGDLPLIGRLFGNRDDASNKTEIMLSITPRLIRNDGRGNGALRSFSSGTENRVRERVDYQAAAPAPANATTSPDAPRRTESAQ